MGYNKQTRYNIDRTGVLSATVLTADLLPFAECHNAYTKNEALLVRVHFSLPSAEPDIRFSSGYTIFEVIDMAKKGMARPEWTHTQPHNDVPPVPEIQGKAKHGKQKANPIIEGSSGPQMKVYHELKGDGSVGDANP